MSRTTAGIMRINQELDKISGLDGIVADKIEELEKQVKAMVADILENHSEASLFNYRGESETVYEVTEKAPFHDDYYCPECGDYVEPSHEYCPHCKIKLGWKIFED